MYADDYDGYYTRGQFWPFTSVHTWMHAIEPYTKNDQILVCPTAKRGEGLYSYGYNIAWWGAGDPLDGMHGLNDAGPVHESCVPTPAQTLWIVDFERYWGCGLEFGLEDPEFRHNGGANAVFVDAHAKWHAKTQPAWWTINED